jgi:hypothetical protein
MQTKNIAVLGVAVAALAAGAALSLPRPEAKAIIGGENLASETEVSPDDPIMACQGEKRGSPDHYNCSRESSEVVGSRRITLSPEKVTDDVAGCLPGNQPSVAKAISYTKTSTISVSGNLKFDLKILTGFTGLFNQIKEYGPGVGVGVSYSVATSFGQSKTYTIPADYGKISWGIFAQDAVESTVNQSIRVNSLHIGGPSPRFYTGYGVKIVTPLEDDTTKFPYGTLAKAQRDFASVEEFNALCPGGVLPPYLGGSGEPEPEPGPEPGDPAAAPCDAFRRVLTEGVDAKAISDNVATDLRNKCGNTENAIRDGKDPAELVAELRRAIQVAETDGLVTREYSARLDAEAAALLDTT